MLASRQFQPGGALGAVQSPDSRPELLPIYQRFGFVETGTEEFTMSRELKSGQKCHCIVMSKQL
jgi:hypothetical protein